MSRSRVKLVIRLDAFFVRIFFIGSDPDPDFMNTVDALSLSLFYFFSVCLL